MRRREQNKERRRERQRQRERWGAQLLQDAERGVVSEIAPGVSWANGMLGNSPMRSDVMGGTAGNGGLGLGAVGLSVDGGSGKIGPGAFKPPLQRDNNGENEGQAAVSGYDPLNLLSSPIFSTKEEVNPLQADLGGVGGENEGKRNTQHAPCPFPSPWQEQTRRAPAWRRPR